MTKEKTMDDVLEDFGNTLADFSKALSDYVDTQHQINLKIMDKLSWLEDNIMSGVQMPYEAWSKSKEEQEPLSQCCGAPLTYTDICSECKEHSGPMEEENGK